MKQNYYEILEVDKNASPEIIKKAYSTLVKKYHPDLQDDNVKHLYEEKLKLINEAYDVLSNEEQRKSYNQTIVDDYAVLEEKVAKLSKENAILRNQYQSLNNSFQNIYQKQTNLYNQAKNNITHQNNYSKEKFRQSTQQAYYTSHIQNSKNQNKYKQDFNNRSKNLIALFLTILILVILWQIPFIRNFILNNTINIK